MIQYPFSHFVNEVCEICQIIKHRDFLYSLVSYCYLQICFFREIMAVHAGLESVEVVIEAWYQPLCSLKNEGYIRDYIVICANNERYLRIFAYKNTYGNVMRTIDTCTARIVRNPSVGVDFQGLNILKKQRLFVILLR